MYIGAVGCVVIGVLIFLYHELKVFQIKDYKEKYDYVNLHEIRYFWYAVVAFICAAAFFFNTMGTEAIEKAGMRWFYVRLFIIASFVVIAYFVFFSLVRIYYPKQLAKRLDKLRNTPRLSPSGNVMRKLSESEEDHHLEASQIEEEKIRVVDYDVWVDDKTGYKKIEKYPISQRSEECSECGFYTLKITKEDVEKEPTQTEEGLLIEHYECSYCGHREKRELIVARLSTNVATLQEEKR
jgi:hypothetical protein